MNKHGWTYKKLGEVCEKGSSDIVISKVSDNNGEYPLFGAAGYIKGLDFYHNDAQYIGIVKDGAGVGRVDIYPAKSSLVGTMQYIFPNDSCDIRFLKYVLINLSLEKFITGATIPHIYFKHYSKCLIPVPPMAEQEAIVAELDEINEAIAALQQQVADLDTLAQSTFYDMFGDPVTNPKAWPVKKLGELSTVKTGPFGSMLHKEDYIVNGIPLVNPVHMMNFKIVPDMSFTIPEHKAQELSNYLLRSNDVVFARRGDIGRCAVVSNEQDGFLCGTGSLFVRFNENVDSIFTMYVIRSESFTNSLLSAAKGATMLNINSTVVENLNFILPPLSLQREFAAKVEAIESAKAELNAQIAEMQTLLASRMDYYFD